ncbi:MAG: transglycosylase domain-containing protein [Paludibacteraceae bacterium]|nr:transglycosylase domain-containing protein [Paludibacteraceae bacterium]
MPKFSLPITEVKYKDRLYGLKMFVLGLLFCILFIFIPVEIYSWLTQLPSTELLITKEVPTPTKILDRKGQLLYEIYIDKRYEPVELEKIPQYVIDATIAVEDDQFYNHIGFDLESTIRAAKATVFDGKLQGGSTITQQLVKNVLLTPDRTIIRKIKELVLSVLVETKYTKDQILELYLNNISYGGSAWGIQSASKKFFNKDVSMLSLAEASFLAGLPSAPSRYSQFYGNYDIVKQRQKFILDRMHQLGYISREDAFSAYNASLEFVEQQEYIRAPHFVAYVRDELERIYGRRYVELGGLKVTTSLDLDLHEKIQKIVSEEVAKNSRLLISNSAAVVLDSRTAQILAYVGSIDYFKKDWGSFDVIRAFRQPGSSIKPLTYALAFERGKTPATIINDSKITFNVVGQQPYTPRNYDNKYHGNVTLRTALANSYNIAAVKLANELGPDNIVRMGKEFGLSNWEVDDSYGLSVTLGGKEVKLLDHTNLYATFARSGVYKDVSSFLSIKDNRGYEVYNDSRDERSIVTEETAYLIWHILSDNSARIPAFGTNNSLTITGQRVAVKTGTTDNIRDNFTIGFTPTYTVGVWVGNNDNSPLHRSLASGLSGAAPIWNKIMSLVLDGKDNEDMVKPDGIITKYDEKCNRSEIFAKGGMIPESLCTDRSGAFGSNDGDD